MPPSRNSIPGNSPRSVPGAPRSVPGAPHYVPGGPTRNFPNFVTTVPNQGSSGGFRDIHRRQIRDFSGRYAGPTGIAWQGLDVAFDRIGEYGEHVERVTSQSIDELASEMESYAKANAPWEDDTTDARQGLKGFAVHSDTRHTAWLGHSVDYGIWLEIRWGGRFAILLPTLREFQHRLPSKIAAGI